MASFCGLKVVEHLKSYGAVNHPILSESVRFAISDDPTLVEVDEAEDLYAVPVVTSKWVELSAEAGQFLPFKAFHPGFKLLFAGIVVVTSELSSNDRLSLWASLTIHGARVQHILDSTVTHLILGRAAGKFYEFCTKELKEDAPVMVTPDWVADCLEKKDLLPCAPYHPDLLKRPPSPSKPPLPKVPPPALEAGAELKFVETTKPKNACLPITTSVATPIQTQVQRSNIPVQSKTSVNQQSLSAMHSAMMGCATSLPGTNLQAATGISVQQLCMKAAEQQQLSGFRQERPGRGGGGRGGVGATGSGRGSGPKRSQQDQRFQQQKYNHAVTAAAGQGRYLATSPGAPHRFPSSRSPSNFTQRFPGAVPNVESAVMMNSSIGQPAMLLTNQGAHMPSGNATGSGHHGKTSKSKSNKHAQEQNLNEEEKDAIVMQNVKNILSLQHTWSREASHGKNCSSSSASEAGSSGGFSGGGSGGSGHNSQVGNNIAAATNSGNGANLMTGYSGMPVSGNTSSSCQRKPKSPKSPGRANAGAVGGGGGFKASPKSPKGSAKINAANKVLSSPQQQQHHQQQAPIVMAGCSSSAVPSVLLASNLQQMPCRQQPGAVPQPSSQQMNRPAAVQQFITSGGLSSHQQNVMQSASAYIVQRHPGGQLLTSVSRPGAQNQLHSQPTGSSVEQHQQAQSTQRQFAGAQLQQPTLFVRTARQSYQNESGEVISDAALTGREINGDLTPVLVSTPQCAQMSNNSGLQSQHSTYQHPQTPHQQHPQQRQSAQNLAQQVILHPSGNQLIQIKSSNPQQNVEQTGNVVGLSGLTQVSNVGLLGRVQHQAPAASSVQVAIHSSVPNHMNKPGHHIQSNAGSLSPGQNLQSPRHLPQSSQPYSSQQQQQQQHMNAHQQQQQQQQQQQKIQLSGPSAQYQSIQGYAQAQQPQQIIFQSPTGQQLIATHHQPMAAGVIRGPPTSSSMPPGSMLLRSVGPNSVSVGGGVSGIPSSQQHFVSINSGQPNAGLPAQLVNGIAGSNVIFQTTASPSPNNAPRHLIQQQQQQQFVQAQPYGQQSTGSTLGQQIKPNQMSMQQSLIRPNQQAVLNTVTASPYHSGGMGSTNISPQGHQPSLRACSQQTSPGQVHHTQVPGQSPHVRLSTSPQTPTRQIVCNQMATNAATTPPTSLAAPVAPIPPTYYGHEGTPKPCRAEECLIGCVILLLGYRSVGETQRALWRRIMRSFGAEVVLVYDPTRVTHIVIDCQLEEPDIIKQALRDRVRIVTIFWVNDILANGRMAPPFEIMHLPSPFSSEITFSFIRSQIVSLTGFEGKERLKVELMIRQLGASFTDYLEPTNTLLVCKKPEGKKYEMAQLWEIPCVNVRWLQDIYFGDLMTLAASVPHKYLSFEPSDVTTALDRCTPRVQDLMIGWLSPIRLNQQAWIRFSILSNNFAEEERERKRKLESQTSNVQKSKKQKSTLSPLADDEVKIAMSSKTRLEVLTSEVQENAKLLDLLGKILRTYDDSDEQISARVSHIESLVANGTVEIQEKPRNTEVFGSVANCAGLSLSATLEAGPNVSLAVAHSGPPGIQKTPSEITGTEQTTSTTQALPRTEVSQQHLVNQPAIIESHTDESTKQAADSNSAVNSAPVMEGCVAEMVKPEPGLAGSKLSLKTENVSPSLMRRSSGTMFKQEDHISTETNSQIEASLKSPLSLPPPEHEGHDETDILRLSRRKRSASEDLSWICSKRPATDPKSTYASAHTPINASLVESKFTDLTPKESVLPKPPADKLDYQVVVSQNNPVQPVSVCENPRQSESTKIRPLFVDSSVRITFTAIDLESRLSLIELCMQLPDCKIVESSEEATHLVCHRLVRTPKTYVAMALGRYLVSPKWIQASVLRGVWLDESPWLLTDLDAESQLGVRLRESMVRAHRRRILGPEAYLFAGLEFWLSPGACHRDMCVTLIKACGGIVRHKRPTQKMALLPQPKQLIICHEDDSHVANYLMRIKTGNKAVHHEEFVLSGVLRQELDFDAYQIQYVNTLQTGLKAAVAAAEAALANSGSSPVQTVLPPPTSLRFGLSQAESVTSHRRATHGKSDASTLCRLKAASMNGSAAEQPQHTQPVRSLEFEASPAESRTATNMIARNPSAQSVPHSKTELPDPAIVHANRCTPLDSGTIDTGNPSVTSCHRFSQSANHAVASVTMSSHHDVNLGYRAPATSLHHLLADSSNENAYPEIVSKGASDHSSTSQLVSSEFIRTTASKAAAHNLTGSPASHFGGPKGFNPISSTDSLVSVTPYRLPAPSNAQLLQEVSRSESLLCGLIPDPQRAVPRTWPGSLLLSSTASNLIQTSPQVHLQPHRPVTALTAMIVAAETGANDLVPAISLGDTDNILPVSSFVLQQTGGFRTQTSSAVHTPIVAGSANLDARIAAADAHAVATATAAAVNALNSNESGKTVPLASPSLRIPRTNHPVGVFGPSASESGKRIPFPPPAHSSIQPMSNLPDVTAVDGASNSASAHLAFPIHTSISERVASPSRSVGEHSQLGTTVNAPIQPVSFGGDAVNSLSHSIGPKPKTESQVSLPVAHVSVLDYPRSKNDLQDVVNHPPEMDCSMASIQLSEDNVSAVARTSSAVGVPCQTCENLPSDEILRPSLPAAAEQQVSTVGSASNQTELASVPITSM
ncbi:unnamed protein product [Calicophoron daubneyi]|uniref:PAX-interacting protein 1 n=1 Tax=Calicophoron daubneyi TaxID=300641 RepID=A0AAV2TIC7_CALDB